MQEEGLSNHNAGEALGSRRRKGHCSPEGEQEMAPPPPSLHPVLWLLKVEMCTLQVWWQLEHMGRGTWTMLHGWGTASLWGRQAPAQDALKR
jgi:hypothetical protein